MSLVSMSKYDSRHQDGDDGMEEWSVWVSIEWMCINTLDHPVRDVRDAPANRGVRCGGRQLRQAVAG